MIKHKVVWLLSQRTRRATSVFRESKAKCSKTWLVFFPFCNQPAKLALTLCEVGMTICRNAVVWPAITGLHWECCCCCCCCCRGCCCSLLLMWRRRTPNMLGGLSGAHRRHNNELITIQPLGGDVARNPRCAALTASRLRFIDHTRAKQNLI